MKKVLIPILLVAVALSGCKNPVSGVSKSPESKTKSISGYAVDDYLIGATVNVFDESNTRVATTTTGKKWLF